MKMHSKKLNQKHYLKNSQNNFHCYLAHLCDPAPDQLGDGRFEN